MSDGFNALDFIMRVEGEGVDSVEEMIDGFAHLIASGLVWGLQGSYGRFAQAMIDNGWIDRDGNVLEYPEPEFD